MSDDLGRTRGLLRRLLQNTFQPYRISGREKLHRGSEIVGYRGQRLVHLMDQRGDVLTQLAHPRQMDQNRLHFVDPALAQSLRGRGRARLAFVQQNNLRDQDQQNEDRR